MTAGQVVILVAIVSVLGSSGPNTCEDSKLMLGACAVVCSSAGLVYGSCAYFNVYVCGGIVDGSGYGLFGCA